MMRKRFKKINKKNTNIITHIVVFFLIFIISIILVNLYGKKSNDDIKNVVDQKIDKILYQLFNELVTNDVINKENINNMLIITKNNKGEILTVNYDLEEAYKILTSITKLLSESIKNLENGKISVNIDDKYLKSGKNGLILYVPFFLSSKNVFLNNLGPKIPILINFNENILTNVKTKVTNYGFNNALLEIYITVEMQKLIITPVARNDSKFNYDILVAALVVNGSVPEFYGGYYQSSSSILNNQ